RFCGLNRTDDSRQHAKHPSFRTARHESGRRRLAKKAAITRAVLRCKYGCLSLEAKHAAERVRFPENNARVVDEVPRRKIIGAIDDHVEITRNLERVR